MNQFESDLLAWCHACVWGENATIRNGRVYGIVNANGKTKSFRIETGVFLNIKTWVY